MDLALRLTPRSSVDPATALAQRIRMVLETQPGDVPFAKTFGCDLDGLLGTSASKARLDEARMRIRGAIDRWVPEATVLACEVRMVDRMAATQHASTPIAESMMAGPAMPASLEVRVVVDTPMGPLHVEAQLTA